MKVMHEKINFKGNSSISIKYDDFPHFTFPWHFHTEFELVYVIKSYGKRFVANHCEEFSAGDLVLLGPNLPHYWQSAEAFMRQEEELKVNAIVLHFPADFFEQQLNSYPEFHKIKQLLRAAQRGIKFQAETAKKLDAPLKRLLKLKGLPQLLALIELLNKLASQKDYQLLASANYQPDLKNWTGNRLDKVIQRINERYRSDIKVADLAREVGMNPTAFCRYFKAKTSKSLTQFVTELRIALACKLLLENQLSVSQIAYESGFNNLSNFNRHFKKVTQQTPLSYKQEFLLQHELAADQQVS